jgi:hypothetical protein
VRIRQHRLFGAEFYLAKSQLACKKACSAQVSNLDRESKHSPHKNDWISESVFPRLRLPALTNLLGVDRFGLAGVGHDGDKPV